MTVTKNPPTEFRPVERTIDNLYVGYADRIERKLKDMNKRLAKLGAPAASVEFGPVVERSEKDPVTGYTRRWKEFEFVTVTGFDAKISGWTPIASLDHTFVTDEGDGEAFISMFPGAVEAEIELPVEFRRVGRGCDHCGTNRKRKTTVVFKGDDGDWINVGTSCLRDFIGVTPATILWLNGWASSLDGEFDDEEGLPREAFEPDLTEVLTVAAAITDSSGFVPSRDWDREPTKHLIETVIWKGFPKDRYGNYTNAAWYDIDWDASKAKAEAVKAWVLEEAERSDSGYIANASLAIRANRASDRSMGLLASLPNAYNRAMGAYAEREARRAAAKAADASSVHIGEVGEKMVLRPVTITKAIRVETMYGTSVRVSGITADGNKVTTFGSGRDLFGVDPDDVVEWRGTVKDHNDGDYGIETEFSRVKLLDLPSDVDFTRVARKGDRVKVAVSGNNRVWELESPRSIPDGWVFVADEDDEMVMGHLFATVTKTGKRDDRFTYTTNAPIGIFYGADIEVLDDDAEFPEWRMTDNDVRRELSPWSHDVRRGELDDDEDGPVLRKTLGARIRKFYEARGMEVGDDKVDAEIARFVAITNPEEEAA